MSIEVKAHITGTVWKIEVDDGDEVHEEDPLIILESMKMEVPIEAPEDGIVGEILVEEGDAVSEGQVVMILEEP
ncbi:MAG: acetyl-CoA carboxylase biotin carboxyl carrier protein subunit [Myxococcales bacterium]|nr:acetyl-CoA carboxylase biotin carboxyl carrier protein subunit [Myxococcales bacterium]